MPRLGLSWVRPQAPPTLTTKSSSLPDKLRSGPSILCLCCGRGSCPPAWGEGLTIHSLCGQLMALSSAVDPWRQHEELVTCVLSLPEDLLHADVLTTDIEAVVQSTLSRLTDMYLATAKDVYDGLGTGCSSQDTEWSTQCIAKMDALVAAGCHSAKICGGAFTLAWAANAAHAKLDTYGAALAATSLVPKAIKAIMGPRSLKEGMGALGIFKGALHCLPMVDVAEFAAHADIVGGILNFIEQKDTALEPTTVQQFLGNVLMNTLMAFVLQDGARGAGLSDAPTRLRVSRFLARMDLQDVLALQLAYAKYMQCTLLYEWEMGVGFASPQPKSPAAELDLEPEPDLDHGTEAQGAPGESVELQQEQEQEQAPMQQEQEQACRSEEPRQAPAQQEPQRRLESQLQEEQDAPVPPTQGTASSLFHAAARASGGAAWRPSVEV